MPCDDGGRLYHTEYVDRPETIRSLCETCRILERNGLLGRLSERTRRWWDAHKKADAEREQREREQAARKRKRKEVISRLTPEEREILGVKE